MVLRLRVFQKEPRRRKIDHDPVDRPCVAAVNQCPLDSMNTLFGSGFGQTDERRSRHCGGRDIDLNLNGVRLDSQQRIRREFSQHELAIPVDNGVPAACS